MLIQNGLLGRRSQHRGGEPEQAKGTDTATVCAVDCIACTVDAERNEICFVNNMREAANFVFLSIVGCSNTPFSREEGINIRHPKLLAIRKILVHWIDHHMAPSGSVHSIIII